jgi:hypothetical protein
MNLVRYKANVVIGPKLLLMMIFKTIQSYHAISVTHYRQKVVIEHRQNVYAVWGSMVIDVKSQQNVNRTLASAKPMGSLIWLLIPVTPSALVIISLLVKHAMNVR